MNDFIAIFERLFNFSPFLIIKAFFIISLVVYTIFALIVARQVDLKRKTVDTPLGASLQLLAILHALAAALLTFYAFLAL